MNDHYAPEEERLLLELARDTLTAVTTGHPLPTVNLAALPPALAEPLACFVTLRVRSDGALRGCTGTLLARRPLAQEVVQITRQTALDDPRFFPVRADETGGLHVEISVLTPPIRLDYSSPDDLVRKLRPCIDGVTLKLEHRRATFLPQVWESYRDPVVFLSLLAQKMGYPPDTWRDPRLEVETYQAVIIEESW